MSYRQIADPHIDVVQLGLDALEGVEGVRHWVAGAGVR